jgi:hypothetical protein
VLGGPARLCRAEGGGVRSELVTTSIRITLLSFGSDMVPTMDATGLEHTALERLSPSRASDFKTCPQLFKFRSIDQAVRSQ